MTSRRKFIKVLSGAAAAWPFVARAQQPAMPVVGFFHTRSPGDAPFLNGFRRGLAEAGYVEGQTVHIEYRHAFGRYERLPALAAELTHRQVAVLVAGGGELSALAAKAATSTIPIVFVIGSDPVKAGLVASHNRPGGNITGINIVTDALGAKRLGLLHEILPQVTTIGFLMNPSFASAESQMREMHEAARAIGLRVHVLPASTDSEIEAAFEIVMHQRITALAVAADPFFNTRRDRLVALAAHHVLPAIFQFREFAAAGGLMSYGIDLSDAYRQAGVYAGRILKGDKPADLPVMLPTKFELVINIKTAKVLGISIPESFLLRADEVIE
jgi:putative ABC transport system substrate-binding protein